MNPNDSTQGMNQGNPNVSNGQFVNPSPIGFDMPQSSVTPVQSVPVQPQSVQQPVTPTPMPAQPQAVNPSPMPAQPQTVNPTPMATVQTKEDPNAKLTEVSVPPSAGNTVNEPQVINTTKSKGSNILLFIVIIILIVFAINIDKMSEMYDNYMKTGSLTASKVTPDNLTDGFIKIDDASSSKKVANIKFYNFKKSTTDTTISFSFEAFAKIEEPSKLNVYIELYNANKELIYKELFDTQSQIEINTTSSYTMNLEEDIHNDAYFALAKVYSGTDLSAQSSLTCKYSDNDYQYENKYYFIGNGLNKYDVSKTSIKEDDTKLLEEYNSLKTKMTVVLDNKTLKYTVDLNEDNTISPLYTKGLTQAVIKNRETLKEWKCE